MTSIHSIHDQLKKTSARLSGHYSDLYAEVTKETKAIIQNYEYKMNVTIFRSQVDGKLYYDIPFANDDYWNNKLKNATGGRLTNINGV